MSARTIKINRFDLIFNDKECLVLNLKDITAHKQLKREQEKSRLLSKLNTSVYHEMISPLKINVDMSMRLIKFFHEHNLTMQLKELTAINISS